jgi:hypothetical protein
VRPRVGLDVDYGAVEVLSACCVHSLMWVPALQPSHTQDCVRQCQDAPDLLV